MIPDIPEILTMLRDGKIDLAQAEAWIRSHIASSEDNGMLRDVFAGLAMTVAMDAHHKGHKLSQVADKIADDAFAMAEAMMKARAK